MNPVSIRIKKLNPAAIIPKYGTAHSAGADLFACLDTESITLEPAQTVFVHTGIAMQIPPQYVGLVYARSGLATKRGVAPANKVGVIDSDYRGEIIVALYNHGTQRQTVENGERIAQIVITPYLTAEFEECLQLDDSERGEGGFGSTGKN